MSSKKQLSNIVGFDFETDGLDASKCNATQICMKVMDAKTLEIIDSYSDYIYPYSRKPAKGSAPKKAKGVVKKNSREPVKDPIHEYNEEIMMKVCGLSVEDLYEKGVNILDVVENICKLLEKAKLYGKKPILLSHNGDGIDVQYLQQLFNQAGLDMSKYLMGTKDFYGNFWPQNIDTLILSRVLLGDKDDIEVADLSFMCNYFEIELMDHHNADADVDACLGIGKNMISRMRADNLGKKKESRDKHFQF